MYNFFFLPWWLSIVTGMLLALNLTSGFFLSFLTTFSLSSGEQLDHPLDHYPANSRRQKSDVVMYPEVSFLLSCHRKFQFCHRNCHRSQVSKYFSCFFFFWLFFIYFSSLLPYLISQIFLPIWLDKGNKVVYLFACFFF